jgi:hypothetical protein
MSEYNVLPRIAETRDKIRKRRRSPRDRREDRQAEPLGIGAMTEPPGRK